MVTNADGDRPKVELKHAPSLTHAEAVKVYGKVVACFLRDVRAAGRKHGIEACCVFMIHEQLMRVASFGTSDKARQTAAMAGQAWADHLASLLNKDREA